MHSRVAIGSDLARDTVGDRAELNWEKFGKLQNADDDQPDPQRHIGKAYIFRAGTSALAVIGEDGTIDSTRAGETGLYVDDMRVVSRLLIKLNGQQPALVRTESDELLTHFLFSFRVPPSQLEGEVDYTLADNALVARLRLKNSGPAITPLTIDVDFAADHYDTFYVRFPPKPARGVLHPPAADERGQTITYDSIDGRRLQSFLRLSEIPLHTPHGAMRLSRTVLPDEQWELVVRAGLDPAVPDGNSWHQVKGALDGQRRLPFARSARITTSNPRLEQWLVQSENDLAVLTANLETGFYPYAGLPWFAAPFGRDGLITGLQTLEINPAILKGVLLHHARHQAREIDVFHQAWPGKIMHERRLGETSRARLNPFSCYYGSVDTTLLYVMAAAAYWRRTGNDAVLESLWPSIDLALRWTSEYADLDGDGLIEYDADPGGGLSNQGWKDSWDSIVHENGDFPKAPIALCEIQGYAYAAWRGAQGMATKLGLKERAAFCRRAAERLYQRFNEVFWQDDLGIYALALDRDKKPCRVRASNMAHLPWCGIVPPDRARRVMNELMGERLFSGWGIRTLAADEKRYNPELYHRGPCWPHELVIASWSAQAVGDFKAMRKLAETALDTAEAFSFRPPELLCGYPRVDGVPPIRYKSANPLHAWAAASAFAEVQAALGMRVFGAKSEISLNLSGLPPGWAPLAIHDLEIGNGKISFQVEPDATGQRRVRILAHQGQPISIRDYSSPRSVQCAR